MTWTHVTPARAVVSRFRGFEVEELSFMIEGE
jgi:hypothetical protein